MKKIYKSNNTFRLINTVFPSDYKLATDTKSNGYTLINSMYSLEVDSIKSYLDQSKHAISFENYDYGYDSNFSYVSFPTLIESGILYGTYNTKDYPITITTHSVFMDGPATRFIYNPTHSIDLPQQTNASGIYGLEYMRTTKEGSGLLFFNTDATTDTPFLYNNVFQTYKLPLSDLMEPDFNNISGIVIGAESVTGNVNDKLEVLSPAGFSNLNRQYKTQTTVYLPDLSTIDRIKRAYTLDYYEPEQYYWDDYTNTYKPQLREFEYYMKGTEKVYMRAMLNNPNGSGVFDTEYLDLAHIPISGTLKVFDLENLTDEDKPFEIPASGINSYTYTTVGDDTKSNYTYLGYYDTVPYEQGLIDDNVPAIYYKTTSWDYVNEEDGLIGFDWVSVASGTITNKIKIKNPISKYIVTYDYLLDKKHYCITTTYGNKYIRYYDSDYIYSQTDLEDNMYDVAVSLSVEKETRRAITFDGFDVRPGSMIDKVELRGILNHTTLIDSSYQFNVNGGTIPGYSNNLTPDIDSVEIVKFNHSINNMIFNSTSNIKPIFINKSYGLRMKDSNAVSDVNVFYELYDEFLTEDRVFKTRFKSQSIAPSFEIMKSVNADSSWKIYLVNGMLHITDFVSSFKTIINIFEGVNDIEIMLIINGDYNTQLNTPRFTLLVSHAGKFYTSIPLAEYPNDQFDEFGADYSSIFNGANIDLDYITIYDKGTL